MATDHELELYVMTGCPYCIKVKHFLADNGVTIPERNISTDSDAEQTLHRRKTPGSLPVHRRQTTLRIERHHRMGTGEPALTLALRPARPNLYDPNMYTSIQSRHFSTSLDAGVQLLGSHGRS